MSQERQLAAIMFTDIEGYTSLMQRDEKNAVVIRKRHREIFKETTETFNGTIIQYFGDGTLSTFKSTLEAIECAIELQRQFTIDPLIPVRIGIHVGDILHSKDDIIGDAVNVTSRIESCALPGSILISDKVHDQIRSHKHIKSTFLDAYELKNVEDAMPLFAISNEGLVVPKPEEVKGKIKESTVRKNKNISKKKAIVIAAIIFAILFSGFLLFQSISTKNRALKDLSIAVLPFDNLSTDSDSEIFRDGITEDILTHLSKIKDLHVISRTSVMRYKETEKTIPMIAKELGVSYILEGSIRKYGDKVRVTAQLIDAKNDEHLWAENYDETLTDIFEIQNQVSKEIVNALHLNLSFDEQQGIATIPTKNIEAYKLFLLGRKEADKRTKESIAKSLEYYKEAITLDKNYAEAYAEIANSIYLETYYAGRNPIEASKLANEYLDKAEKISDKVSRVFSVRGLIHIIEGKYDEALTAFEKAVKLSPNDLTTRHQFSTFYYYTNQYDKQLEQAEIAYSLDPLSFATANSYFNALLGNKKYEEAEKFLNKIRLTTDSKNEYVINISYFRLFMDQKKYEQAINPLKNIVPEHNVFNRYLGFCYAKIGDTINAYKTIDDIHNRANKWEKNHQLAVVFSGLKKRDSVLYHLDTIRNKQTKTFKRERKLYFEFLKDDPDFLQIVNDHGIQIKEKE